MQKGVLSQNMAPIPLVSLLFMFTFYSEFAFRTALSSVTKSVEMTNLQTYIVHVKQPEGRVFSQLEDKESWYQFFMPNTNASSDGQPRMLYSYQNVIGARTFNVAAKAIKGKSEPPIDVDGHGTHTASTAAGGFVKNADALGNAKGTAVGMAPYAHLAIYKVCFRYILDDCPKSDVPAGLDAAVGDGVDVVSLSIGLDSVPFFEDSIAIGSLAAIQKGIFVSCAAGNSGPFNSTLSNEAPWILTVGASTIDRSIVSTAKLADFPSTPLPLVYAGVKGKPESALSGEGSLKGIDVKGKVVLCERGGGIGRIAKGEEVKNAGGAAMILMNEETDGFSTSADAHVLPATRQLCCWTKDQILHKLYRTSYSIHLI